LRGFIEELRAVREPVVEIPVGPLTAETIHLLVRDDAVAAAVAEETDRTPLAVGETIRRLSADGLIEATVDGRWEPTGPQAAERARDIARSGQRRAIADRADREPKERKELLSLLALLGREAPARVFARAVGAAEARILDDLEALARTGLVRLGESGWSTAHDSIGEILAEDFDRNERGRLHLLLARALEAEGGDPAEIARHLSGAGDREAAAVAFCEAARARLDAFAADEAQRLAESGLALVTRPGNRIALLRTRAQARAVRGELSRARDDLRTVVTAIPRGPERSHVLARIAELTSALDDYGQAGELIELALAEAGKDNGARAEALMMSAFFHANRNQVREAEERAAEALALFEHLGDAAGVASVFDLRAVAEFFRGRVVDAAALCDRAARLYRDCGRLLKVGTMRQMRGLMLLMNGRAEDALRENDEALDLERSLGQIEGEATCLCLRAEAMCALGRLEDAQRQASSALALSRELGNRELICRALRALAAHSAEVGDITQAEEHLREAMEVGRGRLSSERFAGAQLASLLAQRGELDAAEQLARQAKDEGIFEFDSRFVLAEIAILRDDPDGERLAAEALALTDDAGYLYSPPRKRFEARLSLYNAGRPSA
jgi:tetratricopeptide (TPR) repeat protein